MGVPLAVEGRASAARTVALALLLALQPAAGCLSTRGAVDAWWETDRSEWDEWPGMEAPEADAPATPWLERYVNASIQETWDRLYEGFPNSSRQALLQQADQHLRWANRSLQAGAPAWALGDLRSARSTVMSERLAGEDGPDRKALHAFRNRTDPAGAWNRTLDALDTAWRTANTTGVPALAALLPELVFVRAAYHDQLAGNLSPSRAPQDYEIAATGTVSFERLATPIAENATELPGPPRAGIDQEALEPLAGRMDAFRDLPDFPDLPPAYRDSNTVLHELLRWTNRFETYRGYGWHDAAAVSALVSLAYAEALHMLHEDRVPSPERSLEALASVSDASGPVEVFVAQLAWDAYAKGEDDPAFMMMPVAVEEVWPVVEAVSAHVEEDASADVDAELAPHVDRWQGSWIQTTREDAEDPL